MLSSSNRALAVVALFVLPLLAQEPPVPAGFARVDDMLLPEEVVFGDGVFTATPWVAGIVPYNYANGVLNTQAVQAERAMAELEAMAFIDFVPRTTQPDYITFVADTINESAVGRVGGQQFVRITNWNTKYIIVHELMHALGYLHEQQRADRNNFITVNYGNIQNGKAHNFDIIPANQTTITGPYDFLSIMHYGPTAFSSNSQPTITCNAPYASFQSQIGNRNFLSLLDAGAIQNRYFSSLSPTMSSISPTTVTSGQGLFTLQVVGTRFFEGSPNASGVQGTRVRWNGIELATTYLNSTLVSALVPASFISTPGIAQVSVINPAPGGGTSFNTIPVNIICGTSVLALPPSTPINVTNGCQQFSISPTYNTFNVVGVTSTSDWDITMGGNSAAAGGSTCDFMAGSGWFGPSTITPTTGNLIHYSGSTAATVQHVTSTALNNGSPTIFSMNSGSIVRALHFSAAAVSTRTIHIAGPTNLSWKLLWQGNSFAWRSSTGSNVVAQGQVGGPAVSGIGIAPTNYCLVIYNNGGPIATAASLTATMCFDFTPAAMVASNFIATIQHGPYSCVPFSIAPQANRWNVVGVSSPTDWDIQIGPAVSQAGGSTCDYVLANGHFGTPSPTVGVTSPYSLSGSPGELQFCYTAQLPSVPGFTNSYTYMLSAFDFEITTPGNYDLYVGAPADYRWHLHAPGTSGAWQSRTSAILQSQVPTPSPIPVQFSTPGWYCVVFSRNGGSGQLANVSVSVNFSATQAPTLSSISPDSAPAQSPTLALTATGTEFTATSVVTWNGTALPTTFQSSTELTADVDVSYLTTPGSALVRVSTPSAGLSAPLSFSIGNAAAQVTAVNPTLIVAGDGAATLTVTGTDFVPGAVVSWNSTPVITTFVSSTELTADVDAYLTVVAGYAWVDATNPAPNGGTLGGAYVYVAEPLLAFASPGLVSIQPQNGAPLTATVIGTYLRPFTTITANGVNLPTTYVSDTQVDVTLDPAQITGLTREGALALFAQNTPNATSNGIPLEVGGGYLNAGLIRTEPIAPAPSSDFFVLIQTPAASVPITVIADIGQPTPVAINVGPNHDFVFGVAPIALSAAWFPIMDGLGAFGPATPDATDANGIAASAIFTAPPSIAGLTIALQAVYLDLTSPINITPTWTMDQFTL